MDQLLSVEDLADLAQVPIGTVYQWNHRRTGPTPIRVGRHVRYRASDVTLWLDSLAGARRTGR